MQVRKLFFMLQNNLLKTACLSILLGLSVMNVGAQTSPTLKATDSLCIWNGTCTTWKWAYTGNPSNCVGGGWWRNTYNDTIVVFKANEFNLTHQSGADTFSYWGGFTTGSNGDTQCYSANCPRPAPCVKPGSWDWVENQWGVMAGGGLNASNKAELGLPYFIAYWNYYQDTQGNPSLQVSLADDSIFAPQEIWICNHPWPYWGNIYGDGFARPLDSIGDRFDLIIHGVKANGTETSITVNLALNLVPGQPPIQQTDWQQIFLTPLGDSIQYLYFTMYSTDSSAQYGPNTAVYFNMDKLTVTKTGKAPTSAIVQKAKASAVPKVVEVTDYFPIASYTGGEAVVHNKNGKEVWKTSLKAGEKPNLSKLPKGEYRLRHGHRVIPIKKVK